MSQDDRPIDRRKFFRHGLRELFRPLAAGLDNIERITHELGKLEGHIQPRPTTNFPVRWLRRLARSTRAISPGHAAAVAPVSTPVRYVALRSIPAPPEPAAHPTLMWPQIPASSAMAPPACATARVERSYPSQLLTSTWEQQFGIRAPACGRAGRPVRSVWTSVQLAVWPSRCRTIALPSIQMVASAAASVSTIVPQPPRASPLCPELLDKVPTVDWQGTLPLPR